MPNLPIHVFVIVADSALCTAFARLLRSAKMEPHTFNVVEDFMRSDFSNKNACVIADIEMPGTSGLALPDLLAQAGHHLPVILVTEHDTPETRTRARLEGATAYFRKPIDDQALLDAIAWALTKGNARPAT